MGVLKCSLYFHSDYKITAGHWPFPSKISKKWPLNIWKLGLNCMDGQPNWLTKFVLLFCTLPLIFPLVTLTTRTARVSARWCRTRVVSSETWSITGLCTPLWTRGSPSQSWSFLGTCTACPVIKVYVWFPQKPIGIYMEDLTLGIIRCYMVYASLSCFLEDWCSHGLF